MADKYNATIVKMHSNGGLLPDHIVCKVTQRNNMRKANTCDPALKHLNEDINSDRHTHKQNIWKEHLDTQWDDTHYLEDHTRSLQQSTSTHTQHLHNI